MRGVDFLERLCAVKRTRACICMTASSVAVAHGRQHIQLENNIKSKAILRKTGNVLLYCTQTFFHESELVERVAVTVTRRRQQARSWQCSPRQCMLSRRGSARRGRREWRGHGDGEEDETDERVDARTGDCAPRMRVRPVPLRNVARCADCARQRLVYRHVRVREHIWKRGGGKSR